MEGLLLLNWITVCIFTIGMVFLIIRQDNLAQLLRETFKTLKELDKRIRKLEDK